MSADQLEDTERRRSLLTHSSNKALFVNSAPSAASSSSSLSSAASSAVSWIGGVFGSGGGSGRDPDTIKNVVTVEEALSVLKRAVETKREAQGVAAMDAMTRIAEEGTASGNNAAALALGVGGACAALDSLLGAHSASPMGCESALRAMCSLTSEEKNRYRLIASGSCFRVVKAAQTHMADDIVVQWALRVLRYMAMDEGSISKLVNCSACDAVSTALCTHCEVDAIVEWTCRIIYCLTYESDLCQERFAAAATCDAVVVSVLQERGANIPLPIAVWGLRAMGGLARRHASNKQRLANLGACELTQQLLQRFGDADEAFVESVCWAVGNLAYPDEVNQGRLAASGACASTVGALSRHSALPDMAQEGFRAIRNLGHLNDQNLELLAEANACEVVMQAITFHGHTPAASPGAKNTLQWGWFAVASLADRMPSVKMLGAAGACHELVHTLATFGSSPDLAQWACLALAKLSLDADISKYVGYEGACRGVVQVLSQHLANEEVVEEACFAVGALCSHEDVKNRELFGDAGIADALTRVVQKHERSEAVAEQACWALSCVLTNPELPSGTALVSKFITAGIGKHLPKLLSRHHENDRIAEFGCQAVVQLSSTANVSFVQKLGAAGVSSSLVTFLQSHASNDVIVAWALEAMYKLCGDRENLAKLRAAGAPAAIARSLQVHHSRSEELSRKALLALGALASEDEACRTKLASLDGCVEAIVAAIYTHADSEDMAVCGCQLISNLCPKEKKGGNSSFSSSSSSVAPSGGSGGSLSSLASGDLGASTSIPVIREGASGFTLFSEHTLSMAERFSNVGIALVVSSLLSKHAASVKVVCAVCKAIEALCLSDGGDANRAKLAQANVCILLMQVMQTHIEDLDYDKPSNPTLVTALCLAMASLTREGNAQMTNQGLLASLKAHEALSKISSRYLNDAAVVETCCKAIAQLAAGNASTQELLFECGATEAVANALKRHVLNESVVVQASLAISELSLNNVSNSNSLGKLGVCRDLVAALVRHRKSERSCEACCRAIFSLKELNVSLGTAGACEAVLPVLAMHPESEAVAQWVCRAIGSLAENQGNKKILGASSACEVVTAALQRHVANESLLSVVLMRSTSSAGVAQWGCTAMYFLARGLGKLEEEYRRKLVAAGACEAVAKALVKYSEVETVAYACCRAVVVLAEGRDGEAHSSRLGALGVCATVVESLHQFPASIPVAKWGCRAAAVLAEGCEGNVSRLAAAGCCEVVPVAMQAHQMSEAVAGAGCDALTSLSAKTEFGYAARLGHTGACEAVVSVLRKHYGNADVSERGCRAMANLALVKGNSSWFGPAGACDALLNVQRANPDDEALAAAAWLAAGNLCVDNNNRHRLGQGGACEQVIGSMRQLIRSQAVARAAGSAIGKLCEYNVLLASPRQHMQLQLQELDAFSSPPPAAQQQQQQIQQQRATTPPPMPHHPTLSATAEGEEIPVADTQNAHLVASMQRGGMGSNRANRDRLFRAGCCEVVIEALLLHVGEVGVAFSLCRTVGILAKGMICQQERDKLGEVGGCAAVVQAMLLFERHEGVSRCGCLAIRALAFDHPKNKEALREAGACEAAVNVLRRHKQAHAGSVVVEAAAWAVSNLAEDCPENKHLLGTAGACESIVEVLDLHSRSLEVSRWCCSAIRHLCDGHEVNRSKIAFSSASELMSNALNKYFECEELVECVFVSMITMSADRVGQHKIGAAGIARHIVAVLQKKNGNERERDYTIDGLACQLISVLSLKSSDNQTRLGNAGVVKALLAMLERSLWMLEANYSHGRGPGGSPSIYNEGERSGVHKVAPRRNSNMGMMDTLKGFASSATASAFSLGGGGGGGGGGSEASSSTSSSSSSSSSFSASTSTNASASSSSASSEQPQRDAVLLSSPDAGTANGGAASMTSSHYTNSLGMLVEEACKALFYLVGGPHEANKAKCMQSGAVDILSAVLNSHASSDASKDLAREALEIL